MGNGACAHMPYATATLLRHMVLPLSLVLVALSSSRAEGQEAGSEETPAQLVPLFAAAGDVEREGFVRVVNRSDAAGFVTVEAIDDAGNVHGTVTLNLGQRETRHFNSEDLENGNPAKGIATGVGDGEGDWRLTFASDLDLEVLAYTRARGFLTTMHDIVPAVGDSHLIATFNPSRNESQLSRLRVVNMGAEEATVTIRGVDDAGAAGAEPVVFQVSAGGARTMTAADLEAGRDVDGQLGAGSGKWRLTVSADQPLTVMSLLESVKTGKLTNLSSRPPPRRMAATRVVPLFLAADSPSGRGFVRVINRSDRAGVVEIFAVDDAGTKLGPVALTLGAGVTRHFNSADLEQGNPAKGLPEGVGNGEGDWRLALASALDFEALAYARSADGFLTAMHDVAERASGADRVPSLPGRTFLVPTFNPASNIVQESRLRIVNLGDGATKVTIVGVDDDGASQSGGVALTLAADAARTLTAAMLESGAGQGGELLKGALGNGKGKWRLLVTAEQPILVMNLLSNRATGHLTNLSSRPARSVHIPDAQLRGAIANALDVPSERPITTTQLHRLLALEAGNADIADLAGLEDAVHLATLGLEGNALVDLSPLVNMQALAKLELGDNQITALEPLAGLRELEVLGLARNALTDVAPLAGLTGLTAINLGGNRLVDLTPLATLTKLREVHIWGCGLGDISALAPLVNLRTLIISANNLRDISVLAGMVELEWLLAGYNALRDIHALAQLTNLTFLSLRNNRISDVAPLAGLENLRTLWLNGNSISDISPLGSLSNLWQLRLGFNNLTRIDALAGATELVTLDLEGNYVADISPLAGLTALRRLNLRANAITDLAPLVANRSFAQGDEATLDITENPLSEESISVHIEALEALGVEVAHSAPYPDDDEFPGSRLTQAFMDKILVMHVEENVQSAIIGGRLGTGEDAMPAYVYTRHFYRWFRDDFDFLILLSNLDDITDHAFTHYSGVYASAMNDVRGIGQGIFFDNRYGSPSRLRGVIHFPWNAALAEGPALHELQHPWSNFAVSTANPGHWGFSSANGQLGGFDFNTFLELGDGRYSVAPFSPSGRGVNDAPYSPIELYFAGFLPPEDVPAIWVAPDGEYAIGQTTDDRGNRVFTSNNPKRLSIDDIIADIGPRVPGVADASKSHRAAVILLVDDDHPVSFAQATTLSEHVTALMQPGEDDAPHFNYHEATGGLATLRLDGLRESRKEAAALPGVPASFGTTPPPRFCLPTPDGGLTHRADPRGAREMRGNWLLALWLHRHHGLGSATGVDVPSKRLFGNGRDPVH